MAVCLGCGLREDYLGQIEVATSSDWDTLVADEDWAGDSLSGAPIYCDQNGQLRTVPEHRSTSNALNVGSNVGLAFSGSTEAVTNPVISYISNPSAVRYATMIVVYAAKFQFRCDIAPFQLRAEVFVDGTSLGDEIAKTWGIPANPNDGTVPYTQEDIIHSVLVLALSPNQTTEIKVVPRITADGGAGVGIFNAYAVAIRALVVTT